MSGENYDLDSLVVSHNSQLSIRPYSKISQDFFFLKTNVGKATDPYIHCPTGSTIRQVNFGDGTGQFKLEDWNRAFKVGATGTHHDVKTIDEGICVVFDRSKCDGKPDKNDGD